MINAVGREIPEEVLKATGKEAFKGAYAYDNHEYKKGRPIYKMCGKQYTEQAGCQHP